MCDGADMLVGDVTGELGGTGFLACLGEKRSYYN